jgi:hypothetical protein
MGRDQPGRDHQQERGWPLRSTRLPRAPLIDFAAQLVDGRRQPSLAVRFRRVVFSDRSVLVARFRVTFRIMFLRFISSPNFGGAKLISVFDWYEIGCVMLKHII